MKRKKTFKDKVPVSVLIPASLQKSLAAKADLEERSFSALVRRAIKRELENTQ